MHRMMNAEALMSVLFCLDRSCEQSFPVGEFWRCFFAQDCHAHLETPALFHEYLYDSANMGYDGVGSSAEAEDFRSRLEASIKLSGASESGSCDNATDETGPLGSRGAMSLEVSSSSSGELRKTAALDRGYGERWQDNIPYIEDSDRAEGTRWERVAQAFALTEAPSEAFGSGSDLLRPEKAGSSAEVSLSTSANGSMTCRAQAHSRPNIFAPACQLHEMIDSVLFTTSHVGDVHFVDLLEGWFSGLLSSVDVLDSHSGVRGGDECGFDPASAQQLAAVVTTGV